tara:strand:- start:5020 stop:6171 length:1152 start_codon:yes stop_codon:yes gene_type:complete
MKKKIAIFGSTGSIGKSLLNIIDKDEKNFKIIFLSAKKNYKELLNQAKRFGVKNIVITDIESYEIAKKKAEKRIKIFNNFKCLSKIFKTKIDYTMNSIVGIDGLKPTLDMIKFTKKIVIANKESIVCGWSLIEKKLIRYKTKFVPVDSEHFSIWFALKNEDINNIEKIYLTASGGPFLNTSQSKLKKIKISEALNHPNWNMGKKISIDSATMMNKVFEIIEAKNIFKLDYKKLSILTHPKSYLHAIIKFKNGLVKTILHDTTMTIPIQNTLYEKNNKSFNSKNLDLETLNNLDLKEVNAKRFPVIKILKNLPMKNSLYETVLVATNDKLVEFYLEGRIEYNQIYPKLWRFINDKKFKKYKRIRPKNLENILNLNEYVRLKIKV